MKLNKWKLALVSIFATLCICTTPMTSVKANAQYEIVFKSGLHGNVNGEKSVSYRLEAGTIFPDDPVVEAESGYVFKGWNKALPEVGSAVEGKQVYVAQYDVLVSGVNYIVRYVDEDRVDIATPKSTMAEEGTTVVERAKQVAGYTYEVSQQSVKMDSKTKEIIFSYTLTNPDLVVRYENETTNQAGTNTNTNQVNNNGNQNNNANNNATTKEKDRESLEDNNETPLAKGNAKRSNDMMTYVMAGLAGLVVLALLIFFVLRKKKAQEQA